RQLLNAAHDFPQVEASAVSFTGAYDMASWSDEYDADGRHIEFSMNPVSDDYAKAMGIAVTRGRWFSHEDDGATVEPTVINERLAGMAFGDTDPIGKILPRDN